MFFVGGAAVLSVLLGMRGGAARRIAMPALVAVLTPRSDVRLAAGRACWLSGLKSVAQPADLRAAVANNAGTVSATAWRQKRSRDGPASTSKPKFGLS